MTVVLYNTMKTLNKMDHITADQVGYASLASPFSMCKIGLQLHIYTCCFLFHKQTVINEAYKNGYDPILRAMIGAKKQYWR